MLITLYRHDLRHYNPSDWFNYVSGKLFLIRRRSFRLHAYSWRKSAHRLFRHSSRYISPSWLPRRGQKKVRNLFGRDGQPYHNFRLEFLLKMKVTGIVPLSNVKNPAFLECYHGEGWNVIHHQWQSQNHCFSDHFSAVALGADFLFICYVRDFFAFKMLHPFWLHKFHDITLTHHVLGGHLTGWLDWLRYETYSVVLCPSSLTVFSGTRLSFNTCAFLEPRQNSVRSTLRNTNVLKLLHNEWLRLISMLQIDSFYQFAALYFGKPPSHKMK